MGLLKCSGACLYGAELSLVMGGGGGVTLHTDPSFTEC